MKPLEKLEEITTTEGRPLSLYRRGGDFYIKIGGEDLMSSRTHGSEEELARIGLTALAPLPLQPAVLIGGLGMGFTLRAALDLLPAQARVVISEVFPAVIKWNRSWLANLAGAPLQDRRVTVMAGDVQTCLAQAQFDLIILDVDNGPDALTLATNHRLYSSSGLNRIREALRPGGVLAVWSASPDRGFLDRMGRAGLEPRSARVRARRKRKGSCHTIFTGQRR
jgi:spermidine synthase